MNITHQFRQIPIRLTEDRFVAALQQVPDLAISPIVILAIPGQQPVHDPAYWVLLALDQQVNMVRHETVSIEIERKPSFLRFHQPEQLRIILVRTKDVLPIVATSDYVIEPALDLDSRLARHVVGILPNSNQKWQYDMPDPNIDIDIGLQHPSPFVEEASTMEIAVQQTVVDMVGIRK
jgi:hypothetical protein